MWCELHYCGAMPAASKARKRTRGEIETLPSGSLRVRVYAGIDPVSKRRHYLTETIPAGPNAAQRPARTPGHRPWQGRGLP